MFVSYLVRKPLLSGQTAQGSDLVRRQAAPFAGSQGARRDPSDGDAAKRLHAMAHSQTHPFHLALA
ncbi:MAG: hypothetical protein QG656_576, partial [Candidatus Hydrogenedentes bacterium]|nr:hypothetical protein [Candidatus Hydrogenedentota bacterium]